MQIKTVGRSASQGDESCSCRPGDDTGSWVDAWSRSEVLRARVLSPTPAHPNPQREKHSSDFLCMGVEPTPRQISTNVERRNTKKGREQNVCTLRPGGHTGSSGAAVPTSRSARSGQRAPPLLPGCCNGVSVARTP